MNSETTRKEVSNKKLLIIAAVLFYIISEGLQGESVYHNWKLLIVKIILSVGFPVLLLTIGSLLGKKTVKLKKYGTLLIAAFVAACLAITGMIIWQWMDGGLEITSAASFIRIFMSNDAESSYWGLRILIGVGAFAPALHILLLHVDVKQVKPYLYLSFLITIASFFLILLETSVPDIWGLRIFSGVILYLLLGWFLEQTVIDKRQIVWWMIVGILSFVFLFAGTWLLNKDAVGNSQTILLDLTSIGCIGFSTACYVAAKTVIKPSEKMIGLQTVFVQTGFLAMLFAAPIRKWIMERPILAEASPKKMLAACILIYGVSVSAAIILFKVWNCLKNSALIRNNRIWIRTSWRFAPGFRIREAIIPVLFLIVSWFLYISHWYLFEGVYWNIAFDWTWVALIGITVFALVKIELSPFLENFLKIIIVIGMPFWIMGISEMVNENNALLLGEAQKRLNYISYSLLFFVFYAITNQIRIAVVLEAILMIGFSIANMYVLRFRGTPILPSDIYSIKTAASVASTYDYSLTPQMLSGIIYLMWIWLVVYPLRRERWRWYRHLASVAAVGVTVYACWTGVVVSGKLKDMGIQRNIWKQEDGYRANGILLSFIENAKDFKLRTPDGYNREEQEMLLAEATKDIKQKKKDYPNIIVVMNESFADIPGMADEGLLNVNKEITPFIDQWDDNVIKGNFLSSVLGGGTAKSEFEFLTGNSAAFYPTGSMPYQQFIHKEMESMASILKDIGYTSIAFHPYLGGGWDRNRVYPLMGFEDFITIDDMPEDMDKVRIYCSDKGDYDKVLDILEEHDKQEGPLFLFNITMQNHGSYLGSYDNFSVDIQESNFNYEELNQYLSLVSLSDKALEELINQLTEREEDVILCMFGDHLPGLDWSFYTKITPNDSEFERTIKAYTVPFYIWANYDLGVEQKDLELTSANYLGMHLLKLIDAPLTPWYQYLEELEKEMPAVSAIGYQDKNGEIHPMDDEAMEYPAMKKYQNMQYYYFYDR